MKPVRQTKFGPDEGNCLPACIASIFEISLDDVPNFHENQNDFGWLDRLNEWVARYGLSAICVDATNDFRIDDAYVILSGKSPRGKFLHAVVWKDGKIIHDPHPDNTGLETWSDFIVFVVRDPAFYVKRAEEEGE